MRSLVCAALLLTVPVQAGAQDGAMASAGQRAWTPGSGTMEVSRCAVSVQGDEAVLSATIVTGAGPGGGPHVKRAEGAKWELDPPEGADFSFGASNGGGVITKGDAGHIVPTVTANAIKTKGMGGSDRSAGQVCATPPGQRLLLPAVQKREARPVATCDVSGDTAMPVFDVDIPLSAFDRLAGGKHQYVGHVTLIKRGINPAGGTVIAQCDLSGSGDRRTPTRHVITKDGYQLVIYT